MEPVDIIVRCYNNWKLTKRCLDSIFRNIPQVQFNLIVVDNGSTDQTPRELLNYECTVIRNPVNYGAVRATNQGLALSLLNPNPFLLILDNDTEIPDGDRTWLERFVAWFEDPEVGAVGATSNYTIGLQHITSSPCRFFDRKGTREVDYQGSSKITVPFLISFAMMLRKEAVKRCGFWDERYKIGNSEDIDYSINLRRNGYKLAIASDVYIHHGEEVADGLRIGSRTFTQITDFKRLVDRNHRILVAKWGVETLKEMGLSCG